ncbi:E22 family MetX-like putative esterase [Alteromonas facilis]|uniref:E22 family MetX-like putative esterase n=1 Tax=Alteromonas facilis TaxID=2048004 RepID=UPI000C28BD72|nr:homoserine O-acetyltransferase [Alteromonas facilis]
MKFIPFSSRQIHAAAITISLLLASVVPAFAEGLLTSKQSFTTENFTFFNGKTIPEVTVGWESYGTLNDAKDNVILITHYFTGNSHAAGKYHNDDPVAGYWDAIIGPGKAIDTNKYFVISVDSLANLSINDPNVITTGPASINPQTGKPYGLDFPVFTMRDLVNVQKAVLESLGISKLYAVAGPSMGSMQAIEWAAAYPEWVPRLISVIGAASADAWTTAALEQWAIPIKLDKHWNNGDYYQGTAPTDGLTASLMFITQIALTPEFFNQQGMQIGQQPLEHSPLHNIQADHSITTWLKERAAQRARLMDANHLLYLVRACQLFMAGQQNDLRQGLARIKAKTLFIPAQQDLLLMPYLAQLAHQNLVQLDKHSQYAELEGSLGHLEGVLGIAQHADTIKRFLDDHEAQATNSPDTLKE